MYSLSISVSSKGLTCDKCSEIVRLTEKILELEKRIQTLVEGSKNLRAVDTALDATSSGSQVKSSHLYLYSAFNNTNCNEALHNIKIGKLCQ